MSSTGSAQPPLNKQTKDEALPASTSEPVLTSNSKEILNDNTTSPDNKIFSEQQTNSDLVSKAQAFLESPELKERDSESKTQFLVTKGIPAETADELQKSLASIPVIPSRTYPEALVAPPKSRLLENLVTLYYFFTYATGASTIMAFAYSRFILPRWSKMLAAKRRLREHQLELLRRLSEELKDHRDKSINAASIAPTTESKEPVLSTKLQELHTQMSNKTPRTARRHTLQSLTDLTGYLSSQYHITSGLSSAMRSYNFQFAMPGAASNASNDTHNEIKKDLRALKGLLINRRTFLQGSSALRPANSEPTY